MSLTFQEDSNNWTKVFCYDAFQVKKNSKEISKKSAAKNFLFFIFWKFYFSNTIKWSNFNIGLYIPRIQIKIWTHWQNTIFDLTSIEMYRGENVFFSIKGTLIRNQFFFYIFRYACISICHTILCHNQQGDNFL